MAKYRWRRNSHGSAVRAPNYQRETYYYRPSFTADLEKGCFRINLIPTIAGDRQPLPTRIGAETPERAASRPRAVAAMVLLIMEYSVENPLLSLKEPWSVMRSMSWRVTRGQPSAVQHTVRAAETA